MREILFRAKQKDKGNWVEGYYIRQDETTYCFKEDYERHPENTKHYIVFDMSIDWGLPNRHLMAEIDPETLCQYTGLTDKNGKRIWENDILHRAYHSEEDYIVVWDDGRFNFKTIHGQYSQDPMTLLSLCFTQINAKRLKVIGNVFDNPELLKGE